MPTIPKEFPDEYRSYLNVLLKPFPLLEFPLQWKWGWILAQQISLSEYDVFCSANDFEDLSFRNKKEIEFEYFSGQLVMTVHIRNTHSFFHNQISLDFALIYRNWIETFPDSIRNFSMTAKDCPLRTLEASFIPDILLGTFGEPRIIVEVAYSEKLSDAHLKMQEMLKYPTVKAGILVKVRYPWSKLTEDENLFEPNDSLLLLIYYAKPDNYGNPLFNDIPAPTPQTIINFGNEKLTEAEINYIMDQTEFTGSIRGYGFTTDKYCKAANLPAYQFIVPVQAIVELNDHPGQTFTDELVENFPTHRNLCFDLYRIKRGAKKVVYLENYSTVYSPLLKT
jgi:hypothetical protein